MDENLETTKEIAKTTGKAIDAASGLGRFVARLVQGPLEQASGIVQDKLIYMRAERQIRLQEQFAALLESKGLQAPTRAVPLKIAIPLLQAATMEEDNYLQDLWANLLANAADANSGKTIQRVYIDILESLGPLEAKILDRIYEVSSDERSESFYTRDLPEKAHPKTLSDEGYERPSADVELALGNLVRLGCLTGDSTWGGGMILSGVHQTPLGKAFVAACKYRD